MHDGCVTKMKRDRVALAEYARALLYGHTINPRPGLTLRHGIDVVTLGKASQNLPNLLTPSKHLQDP